MRMFLIIAALLVAAPAAAQKADDYLGSCIGADPPSANSWTRSCEEVQRDFKKQFQKAMRGDYTSQRNVAFWIGGREHYQPSAMIPNKITACAWRFVIVASGDPQVGSIDTDMLKQDCDKLDPVEVAAAQAQAMALAKKIKR